MSDYYEILGVPKTATQDEIKQAYRKLAKVHHPDKGGDAETFKKIQTAHETLSDEQKRAEYDNPMPKGFPFAGGGMPGGFPFTAGMPGGMHGGMHGGMPDIFTGGGGGGSPFDFLFGNRQQKRKNNTNHVIKITLYDVFFGLKKTLSIKQDIQCNICNKKCPTCGGSGTVKQLLNMGVMQVVQQQPCGNCNTTGIIRDTSQANCTSCNNNGFNTKANKVDVNIPRGVENGTQLVFEGLGEIAKNPNEVNGDLIVIVQIDEGSLFKRDGQLDLIYENTITFKESVIGKKLLIPHFEKEFTVNTRELGIINPTKRYMISNKGLINNNGNRGNLYIKFSINYSRKLFTEEELMKLNNIL